MRLETLLVVIVVPEPVVPFAVAVPPLLAELTALTPVIVVPVTDALSPEIALASAIPASVEFVAVVAPKVLPVTTAVFALTA